MSAQNQPESGRFCIKNKPERGFSLIYVRLVLTVCGQCGAARDRTHFVLTLSLG